MHIPHLLNIKEETKKKRILMKIK